MLMIVPWLQLVRNLIHSNVFVIEQYSVYKYRLLFQGDSEIYCLQFYILLEALSLGQYPKTVTSSQSIREQNFCWSHNNHKCLLMYIVGAARNRYRSAKESEIEYELAEFLKHAPHRPGGTKFKVIATTFGLLYNVSTISSISACTIVSSVTWCNQHCCCRVFKSFFLN